MIDDPHLATAREFERSARHTLTDACGTDIAILDRLCADAFANARAAFEDALGSAGYDQNGMHKLLNERARVIAEHCTRRVRDTTNVRFRARFRSYAEAVWETESRLVARPRRIALPRIHIRAVQPAIGAHASPDDIVEAWMLDLTTQLHAAVREAVAIAVETVIKRLIASVSRSRTAHALFTLRSVTPS
ncbi:MAG TPA: hypothetical protein VGG22_13565 [Candidatus Baltobacteraceae bacterium]|jgi:hypothetical protein